MNSNRKSQCDRILALITSYGEFGCPLPEILDLRIANYRARISELRAQRFDIRCETKWVDGIQHSRYKFCGQLAKGNAA